MDPDLYCEMQLANHAQALVSTDRNYALEIVVLIQKNRPHVPLKDCFETAKDIEIIQKLLASHKTIKEKKVKK